MYFLDHNPSHFHASYGDYEAKIQLSPIALLSGKLPPRVLALVIEWASLHREELQHNWRRLHSDQPAHRIAPLE